MRRALIVDIQNTEARQFPNQNRKFYLQQWEERGVPIHIALTPYQRDRWYDLENEIVRLVRRPGSGLLVEGLLHTCSQRNHRIRDPNHESICTSWFQKDAPYEKQAESILEGIDFFKRNLGVRPIGYLPPQHLWNQATVKAVEQAGLRYIITGAIFSDMHPYRVENVIVVPSGSVKRKAINNQVVHVYYDRIQEEAELVAEIELSVIPLADIPIESKKTTHTINEQALRVAKQMRDGGRLIRWLWDAEVRRNPDADALREIRREQNERNKFRIHDEQR